MKIKTLFIAFCGFFLFQFCKNTPPQYQSQNTEPPKPSGKSGKEIAEIYCSSCHQFPEPNLLDKASWTTELLPNMGARLGIATPNYDPFKKLSPSDKMMVGAENIYPKTPLLATEDWAKIVDYYKTEAPDKLTQPKNQDAVGILKNFEAHLPPQGYWSPTTTLTKITEGGIFIGNLGRQLFHLSPQLKVLDSFDLPAPPVHFIYNGLITNVLCVGTIVPNEMQDGRFVSFNKNNKLPKTEFENLRRPVFFTETDLTGDGQNEVVVCEYGYQKGQLSYFEQEKGVWKGYLLSPTAGASKVFAHDFDKDGRNDLAVLFAQGDERVSIFYNRGNRRFEETTVLRFSPVHGSADMRWVDFNGDGALDIVMANGDNEDFSPILKPYHGVRLYLNNGKQQFTEGWFYPMHGAFQAIPADFDGDGDLDIAVSSFFPNDRKRAASHFVLLEQTAPMQFKPQTFNAATRGKWLTMDAGDADGDGDLDILLGAFSIERTQLKKRNVEENLLPFVFLENKKVKK